MSVEITQFALDRHWNPEFTGTQVPMPPNEFLASLPEPLMKSPGYADFCEKWTYENTWGVLNPVAKITPENEHLLKSGYKARREGELPVLTRWFEGLPKPVAKYVTLVVYSKEQLAKEGTATQADWGVVAVLASDSPYDLLMTPCTMIRNHLGAEFGGSGVPIDRDIYMCSVEQWSNHAMIK